MTVKIDTLTDAQKARMASWVQEWIERGLSCEPADRAAVEAGMAECYRFAGLPWHGRVVWVESPLVVALAGPIAGYLLGGDAVDDAVGDAVRGAVRGAVHGAVGDAVGDAWWKYLGGQWWISWQAWTSFFRDVCDLELDSGIWGRDRAYAAAQSAGWWWPHKEFVIVSDRPAEIHRERVGPDGWGSHRLHREDGPAVLFRDGWAVWAWHGLMVPRWVVESPTLELIAAEENAEIRRAGIESFSWDRWLKEAQLSPVAVCDDPGNAPHRLELFDVPVGLYPTAVRLLVMTNGSVERDGTRRRYAETVPAEIGDPLTAAAWRVGLSREDYAAIQRRT